MLLRAAGRSASRSSVLERVELALELHDLALATRELGPQPLDLPAQRARLGPEDLAGLLGGRPPAPAPALVGQRQLDHDAAADLELGGG